MNLSILALKMINYYDIAHSHYKYKKHDIFLYIKLDLNTDANELKLHFESCGTIERVTIVCDKYTGKPKGCAYIQFKSQESVAAACLLNDKEFNGRIIQVCLQNTKLTLLPFFFFPSCLSPSSFSPFLHAIFTLIPIPVVYCLLCFFLCCCTWNLRYIDFCIQ